MSFVEELYGSGMVDNSERQEMLAPLDKKFRYHTLSTSFLSAPVWLW